MDMWSTTKANRCGTVTLTGAVAHSLEYTRTKETLQRWVSSLKFPFSPHCPPPPSNHQCSAIIQLTSAPQSSNLPAPQSSNLPVHRNHPTCQCTAISLLASATIIQPTSAPQSAYLPVHRHHPTHQCTAITQPVAALQAVRGIHLMHIGDLAKTTRPTASPINRGNQRAAKQASGGQRFSEGNCRDSAFLPEIIKLLPLWKSCQVSDDMLMPADRCLLTTLCHSHTSMKPPDSANTGATHSGSSSPMGVCQGATQSRSTTLCRN